MDCFNVCVDTVHIVAGFMTTSRVNTELYWCGSGAPGRWPRWALMVKLLVEHSHGWYAGLYRVFTTWCKQPVALWWGGALPQSNGSINHRQTLGLPLEQRPEMFGFRTHRWECHQLKWWPYTAGRIEVEAAGVPLCCQNKHGGQYFLWSRCSIFLFNCSCRCTFLRWVTEGRYVNKLPSLS